MKKNFIILLFVSFLSATLLEDATKQFQDGEINLGISTCKKAVEAGENRILSYFNMANGYFQLDSLPQAVNYYRRSLQYAPTFFRGWLNLSTAYYRLNDMGETIASARRALLIEPNNEKALFILATAYRSSKATALAVITFEQLIEINPKEADGYIALAELYSDLGDYKKSIEWLSFYPEDEGENDSYIATMQAELASKMGDSDSELYYLRKAFNLDDSNRWILYRIIERLESMGSSLLALEEADNGLDLFPNFAEIGLLGGNIAFALGDFIRAEHFYSSARDNGSANAVIGLENVRLSIISGN